jgi:hypothetical protein
VGPGSTLRYHCERLPYVACPWARVSHVGQVYTPTRLVIDLDLSDTLDMSDSLFIALTM